MIVLMIVIAILLLIFVVPYGIDAAYEEGTVRLGVKAGPFRIWILPKKPKTEKQLLKQQRKEERKKAGLFKDVESHDIVKFGLIPELVGRLPVIVALSDLDKNALVRIISEPKSSLVKQYKKLFEMDGVKLEFADGALEEVAQLALDRNTGARGLRAILENIMTGIMYEIPSRADVDTVVITPETVRGAKPEYILKREIPVAE